MTGILCRLCTRSWFWTYHDVIRYAQQKWAKKLWRFILRWLIQIAVIRYAYLLVFFFCVHRLCFSLYTFIPLLLLLLLFLLLLVSFFFLLIPMFIVLAHSHSRYHSYSSRDWLHQRRTSMHIILMRYHLALFLSLVLCFCVFLSRFVRCISIENTYTFRLKLWTTDVCYQLNFVLK